MAGNTVNLATLIRGKTYSFHNSGSYVNFERGIPVQVSDEMADALEELVDVIGSDDGDPIETERFRVERNVSPSRLVKDAEREEGATRVRARIVREEVPVRKPLAMRKAPVVAARPKPPVGFGRRNTGE